MKRVIFLTLLIYSCNDSSIGHQHPHTHYIGHEHEINGKCASKYPDGGYTKCYDWIESEIDCLNKASQNPGERAYLWFDNITCEELCNQESQYYIDSSCIIEYENGISVPDDDPCTGSYCSLAFPNSLNLALLKLNNPEIF